MRVNENVLAFFRRPCTCFDHVELQMKSRTVLCQTAGVFFSANIPLHAKSAAGLGTTYLRRLWCLGRRRGQRSSGSSETGSPAGRRERPGDSRESML